MKRSIVLVAAVCLLGATACEKDPDDPKTWIDQLSNPAARPDALRRLQHLHKPASIKPLGEAWKKYNKSSQILRAMIAIADTDEKHPQANWHDALPYLEDAVSSYSPDNDRSVDDAKVACEALGKAADPSALDTLVAAANQVLPKSHVGNRVKIAAISALASFPKDPKAIDTLIKVLAGDPEKQSPLLNGAAALAIGQSGDPKAIPELTKAMFISAIFNQVRQAIARVGKPAIAPMELLVQEKDPDINAFFLAKGYDVKLPDGTIKQNVPGAKIMSAAQMLGDLHASEAIQVLVGVLKDKTKNNGHNAVLNALLNIDDPSTADTIRAYYLDKTTDDGMKSVAINVYAIVASGALPAELLDYADGKLPAEIDDPDVKNAIMTSSMLAVGRLGRDAEKKTVADRMTTWAAKLKDFQDKAKDPDAKEKAAETAEKAAETAAAGKKPEDPASKALATAQKALSDAQDVAAKADKNVNDSQQTLALWQDAAWRIDVAVQCKKDPACYIKFLTPDPKTVGDGKPGSPQEQRAILELARLGSGAESATDALLKSAASADRFIRQYAQIALPRVAKLPCQKCSDELGKIVTKQAEDSTLSLLLPDTKILQNYFIWAGK